MGENNPTHRRALLQLQTEILRFLENPTRRGSQVQHETPRQILAGISLDPLLILGELASEKRMTKVAKLLPRTVHYLKPARTVIAEDFMSNHPPLTASSYDNACQFYLFLRRRHRIEPSDPPFLVDLAYCELAIASLERSSTPPMSHKSLRHSMPLEAVMIRRRPGIHMREARFDIGPLLEDPTNTVELVNSKATFLLLGKPTLNGGVTIAEVTEPVYRFLKGLGSWHALRREDIQDDNSMHLLSRLEGLGMLEVRQCGSV